MAIFGDYRCRCICGRSRPVMVREIDVDNANDDWESDEEGQEDDDHEGDTENCGILNNTVFNLND